jgi:sporulation protein YlmC with PRC-barrel domain
MTARTMLAGLQLLDRQLVDRHGRPAGKVDDVELERDPDTGHLVVTALRSGRGSLWRRLGATRLADWLQALPPVDTGADDEDDAADLARGRIPVRRVAELGSTITLAADADELATDAGERVVRRHLVGRVPGSRDVAE